MEKVVYEHKKKPIRLQHDNILSPIPHFHSQIEFIYVKNGSSIAHAEQQVYNLNCGDLFISFPNQIHYFENTTFGEYFVLIIKPELFYELDKIYNKFLLTDNIIDTKENDGIYELLSQIFSAEGEFKNTLIVGLLNQCMALILPKLKFKPINKPENSTLQSILEFCAQNFANDISLENISNELHLNKYHISHLFNSKININFKTYINMLRIDKACNLLENTTKKAIDISEEVGFGSISSFNRAFLKITGTTPLNYRAKHIYQNKKTQCT